MSGTPWKPAIAPHGAKCSYPVGGPYCGKDALYEVQGYFYCEKHVGKAYFDKSLHREDSEDKE